MQNSCTFQHAPLKGWRDFRLCYLEPGHGENPIHCTIRNFDFLNCPEYEAVSYEWGDFAPDSDQPIFINGFPVKIRVNLYNALLRFRRSRYQRQLWIDALCIDQDNKSEKKRQIQLMGRIYRHAWDVLVWLGLSYAGSDLAISHLKKLGLLGHDGALAILSNADNPDEEKMSAILALCNRSYWRRIWIVQEVRLASQITFYCGNETIPGETFRSAGKYISQATNSGIRNILQNIRSSMASRIADYRHSEDLCLKDWLNITHDSLCSDPRDRVYALLNLATDCRGIIQADYTLSLSQVYKEVLKLCSVDRVTRRPGYEVLELSQVLQRALNHQEEHVQLIAWDTEPVWLCGILSAQITSFDRDFKAALEYELRPKNIYQGHTTTVSPNPTDCILTPDAGMEIISKRRDSGLNGSVQSIHDIMIATSPIESPVCATFEAEPEQDEKLSMSCFPDIVRYGKPCFCALQACSGLAPLDAEVGDRICRFPGSRVGLVFREIAGDKAVAGKLRLRLVGRAIMDERFQLAEKENERFWRGNPSDLTSVSFGSENGWYLKLDMVTLQRLTGE